MTAIVGGRFGRRQCIGTGCIFLIIGAALQASSFSLAQLIVGRIVSGCGVGFYQSTIPVLQSEVSPSGSRGIYATAYLSALNFGILLSYWINYGIAFANSDVSWRFPTAFQVVFVAAIFVLSFLVPESPRFLMLNDRTEDAAEVVSHLLDKDKEDFEVVELLNQIKSAVMIEIAEGSGSWMDFVKDDNLQTRRRLWSACLVQIFQQLVSSRSYFFQCVNDRFTN